MLLCFAFLLCAAIQQQLNGQTLDEVGDTFLWLEHSETFNKPGKTQMDRVIMRVEGTVEFEGQNGVMQKASVAKTISQLLVASGATKKRGNAPMGDVERRIQSKTYKKGK